MTLPHKRYGEWLRILYAKMAVHVPPGADVVEVCVRPEDRGVISRGIIPHATFTPVDRDPVRAQACGGYQVDVLDTKVRADVVISTALLHHTREADLPRVLANLCAPLLLLSGPTADTHAPYGDHLWHLDENQLRGWLGALGYAMTWERIGLTEPFCEALVVARCA